MRNVFLAGLAAGGFLLFGGAAAEARQYPWCAQYTGNLLTYHCGFATRAQCMATVHGVGGFCRANPWYAGQPERDRWARR